MKDLTVFSRVPSALTERKQWVVWRYVTRAVASKATKEPFNARRPERHASTSSARTWSDYATALDAYAAHDDLAGIGFVFDNDRDGLWGIDLDNSLAPDLSPLAWARPILARLAPRSYFEVSPSLGGVKGILSGTLPGVGRKRDGFGEGSGAVEMYDRGRFFTITGNRFPGSPFIIGAAADEPTTLYAETFPPVRLKVATVPLFGTTQRKPDAASQLGRCRAYVARLPDAISGAGGHNATLRAAAECFRFGLSDSEALDVLNWFNAHKTGGEPWSDRELMHKLTDARRKVESAGEIGTRLQGDGQPARRVDVQRIAFRLRPVMSGKAVLA
jgi:hypothetical protein